MADGRQDGISKVTLENCRQPVVQLSQGEGSRCGIGWRHPADEGDCISTPTPMVFDNEGAHGDERVVAPLVGSGKFGRPPVNVRGPASKSFLRQSARDGDVYVDGPLAARDVHDKIHARIGPAGVCQRQYHLFVH